MKLKYLSDMKKSEATDIEPITKAAKHKISDVKVHGIESAESAVSDVASNVHYSANINGKRHKFYTEALSNKVVNDMEDGKVSKDVHEHISYQHDNDEGTPVKS